MEWFKRVKKSFKDLKKKSATEGESIIEVLDKKYVDIITKYEFWANKQWRELIIFYLITLLSFF